MSIAKKKQAMRKRASRDIQSPAEKPSKVEGKTDDELSSLPPSMQEHIIASLNRNREAFKRLAKL